MSNRTITSHRVTAVIGGVALTAALGFASPAAATPRGPAVTPAATTGQTAYLVTDAPVAIHVGARYTEVPVTVGTTGSQEADLTLVDPQNGQIDFEYSGTTANRYKFVASFYSFEISRYGSYRWDVSDVDGSFQDHVLSVRTSVRANSLLGFSTVRSGSTVTFTVASRQWNNAAERYQGHGTGVYIQKQATNGSWVNVGGVGLPTSGNGVKKLGTGAGVYRLYDHDTALTWGSTTPAARVG